jgi:hypothetical protein
VPASLRCTLQADGGTGVYDEVPHPFLRVWDLLKVSHLILPPVRMLDVSRRCMRTVHADVRC